MANLPIRNASGVLEYVAAKGDGTDLDPYITGFLPTAGVKTPVQLTITNGTYAVDDSVGGLITIANAARGSALLSRLQSVTFVAKVAIAYNLILLSGDIATPVADNGALALVEADLTKVLGVIPVVSGDWKNFSSAYKVATISNIGLLVRPTATTIYAYLAATATTSPATTRMDISFQFEYLE